MNKPKKCSCGEFPIFYKGIGYCKIVCNNCGKEVTVRGDNPDDIEKTAIKHWNGVN